MPRPMWLTGAGKCLKKLRPVRCGQYEPQGTPLIAPRGARPAAGVLMVTHGHSTTPRTLRKAAR
eukprot:15152771-Heterocapsa_arctica.AAC.1